MQLTFDASFDGTGLQQGRKRRLLLLAIRRMQMVGLRHSVSCASASRCMLVPARGDKT